MFAGERTAKGRILQELAEFVRYPSISATATHAAGIRSCAAWLANHLRSIGLDHAAVLPTVGHPVVFADWRHAPGRPTVLIYGHYDVQPAEPLDAWRSPPFTPTVRGEGLYGRGASGDKGQLFIHVKAIKSLLKSRGRLPVNVVCLFEGEEEIGSPNRGAFLRQHRHLLAAEVAVIAAGGTLRCPDLGGCWGDAEQRRAWLLAL